MSRPLLVWLVAVLGAGALLVSAGAVLTPFVIALILAYIGSPAVERLAAGPLGRVGATLVVLLGLTVVVIAIPLLLLPLLVGQLVAIAGELPATLGALWAWLGANVPAFAFMAETDMRELVAAWKPSADHLAGAKVAGEMVAEVLGEIGGFAGFVLTTLLLTPLVAFYLLRDFPSLVRRSGAAIPPQLRPEVTNVARIFDRTLSEFLRAQFSVMLLMALIYSALLLIAGAPYAIAVGLVAGMLSFIPYAGFALGLVLALAVTALNLDSWLDLVWVVLAMGAGSLVEGFFLTPKIVGEKAGLGPVAVILAITVMGALFGFVGMLVAVPLAAMVLALLRHYVTDRPAPAANP